MVGRKEGKARDTACRGANGVFKQSRCMTAGPKRTTT